MRFPGERFGASSLAITALMALGGCSVLSSGDKSEAVSVSANPAERANTPAADYPLVVGDPYMVDGKLFTPNDTLNYDAVGFAASDRLGGNTVSGSHRTLPLPSYVEVTSLESGRTVLVRLERRGMMYGNSEVGLSNGALAQLGAQPGVPVRVRRVLPPELERAKLRAGERASVRMETPQSLISVLRRKLPAEGFVVGTPPPLELARVEMPASQVASNEDLPELPPAPLPAATPVDARNANNPASVGVPALPPLDEVGAQAPVRPQVRVAAVNSVASGDFVVQAAAFSSQERANTAATKLAGQVSKAGRFYRVRTGPFASRGEAESALAKVRAAGYSDATIYKN